MFLTYGAWNHTLKIVKGYTTQAFVSTSQKYSLIVYTVVLIYRITIFCTKIRERWPICNWTCTLIKKRWLENVLNSYVCHGHVKGQNLLRFRVTVVMYRPFSRS